MTSGTRDYYAALASLQACPAELRDAAALVAGFVDGCTAWSSRGEQAKTEARLCYMQRVLALQELALPNELNFEPDFAVLPDPCWVGFQVEFLLQRPWYSKDDRVLHVLDNPLRKDRAFGVPYMPASSWKGLLRWVCRVKAGLHDQLESKPFEQWKEPNWILHLFGNEKGKENQFHHGALAFYPTWFNSIGFEAINPHSRRTRAGTHPVYYEVVPAGTKGVLSLLYAPLPGTIQRDGVNLFEALTHLLDAIEALLTTYGISAKRTAGWGTAAVTQWRAYRCGHAFVTKQSLESFLAAIGSWFVVEGERQ